MSADIWLKIPVANASIFLNICQKYNNKFFVADYCKKETEGKLQGIIVAVKCFTCEETF